MKKIRGFTMIELLIVIAVLGILAVAVLSAINPLEQINKGRDTQTRSDSEQLLTGFDRYNASLGYYPWTTGINDDDIDVVWTSLQSGGDLDDQSIEDTLDALVETAEVKDAFITRLLDSTASRAIYVYYGGAAGQSIYACFEPRSNSFAQQAADACTAGLAEDAPTDACPDDCETSLSDANACYLCLP